MDISGKLLIIAMITYVTLFCGFVIAGIILKLFIKHNVEKGGMEGKKAKDKRDNKVCNSAQVP